MVKTVDFEPLTQAARLKDLSDADLREAIVGLLLRHPTLGMSGFDVRFDDAGSLLTPEGVEQVRQALRYLASDAVQLTATVNRRLTSYAWKHLCEHWVGAYTSNGSFLAAALLAGLAWKRIPDSSNATVALAEVRQPERLSRSGVRHWAA